ncbi:MAG: cyclic peptide export ABC transporter [Lewinellaceae bacterium]|nr:cyclic peptide export ABC transporter [Lewinellaceae bacterium]
MDIFKLFNKSKTFFALIIVLGLVNSVMYSGLLIMINQGLRTGTAESWMDRHLAWLFAGLMALSFFSRRYFQNHLIAFTNNILFDFELSLLDKVRFATFESFRKLGSQKVYTAIGDTKVVAQLPRFFVDLINNAVVVVCALGYLLWISPVSLLIVLAIMTGLSIYYWVRNQSIVRDLNRIRNMENDFYRYLQDLLNGFREVKMSVEKNENLYRKFLEKNRQEVKSLETTTARKYLDNELFGSYSWYVILGIVIFLLPALQVADLAQQTTFVLVILYLMGPMAFLINSFSTASRMQIAFNRLGQFYQDLSAVTGSNNFGKELKVDEVRNIRLEGVTYTYKHDQSGREFTLGPIDLELETGRTIFIIGENGSGKSTFLLLLAGLLKPDSGTIYINDHPVDPESLPHYSNLFSSIFADPHFFSEQYSNYDIRLSHQLWEKFTGLMRLNDIVKVDGSRNLANSNLSKGQQKRLLMIYALMENKQCLLLDEWAAEQDPGYRAVFYHHVLGHMKELGKTIIAITHDDRYYHFADRLITFHDGKLLEDRKTDFTDEPMRYERNGI